MHDWLYRWLYGDRDRRIAQYNERAQRHGLTVTDDSLTGY
jgi:hypothetical protein